MFNYFATKIWCYVIFKVSDMYGPAEGKALTPEEAWAARSTMPLMQCSVGACVSARTPNRRYVRGVSGQPSEAQLNTSQEWKTQLRGSISKTFPILTAMEMKGP
jgi:hypothetical protein